MTGPLYSTSNVTQASYILNNANIRILFVGDQVQYDVAKLLFKLCPKLTDIIVFNEYIDISDCPKAYSLSTLMQKSSPQFLTELKQRIAQYQLSDLFTLIYTSGTTVEPKGVMLDYANMAAQLYLHDERLTLTESDISLCFLPLSHVFERAWSFYVMHIGAQNIYLTDAHSVREAMVAVKPTVMCAVPRFYEKVYAAINQKVSKASWLRRALFNWALRQGKRQVALVQQGKKATCYIVFFIVMQINGY